MSKYITLRGNDIIIFSHVFFCIQAPTDTARSKVHSIFDEQRSCEKRDELIIIYGIYLPPKMTCTSKGVIDENINEKRHCGTLDNIV